MKSAAQRNLNSSPSSCIWSRNKKMAAVFFCCSLLLSTILTPADATRTCTRIEGAYRDCLCGVMFKDVETHCQDEDTYYLPEVSQQNLSCPFRCLNGGTLSHNSCICNAGPDAQPSHGFCYEVRKFSFLQHASYIITHAHNSNTIPTCFQACGL